MPYPYDWPIIWADPQAFAVLVDDLFVNTKWQSVNVTLRIEERGTAQFIIVDEDGTGSYPRGTPVKIYDLEDVLIFAGFIDKPVQKRIAPAGGLYHQIVCTDNHYLADKRLIVKVYTGELAGDIFENIVDDYLAAEGITYTADSIEDGPTIDSAVFNYVKASEAFDAIKELSGIYTWFIDENKVIYFTERSTNVAPWALDGVTNRPNKGSTSLDGGSPKYRNYQYVRGGTGVTAQQTENFTGDGVQVAFVVGYPIATVPTVTVNAVGQTVGIKGIDSGKQCYWNKGDGTVTFAAAPGAVAVVIVYYGQYPLMAFSTDEGQRVIRQGIEGSTGIVEDIAFEAQHETSDSVEDSAVAKLVQFAQESERYRFETFTRGLKPGQLLTVTDSAYGLVANEMLIESVSIAPNRSVAAYTVVAITGAAVGSWSKFFTNILRRQDNSIRLGDTSLLVLLQEYETLELSEVTSRFEDDFSGGEVGRWLQLPPAQSEGHHVQHEAIELSEAQTRWEQAIADGYCWAVKSNGGAMREAVWDFFSWG